MNRAENALPGGCTQHGPQEESTACRVSSDVLAAEMVGTWGEMILLQRMRKNDSTAKDGDVPRGTLPSALHTVGQRISQERKRASNIECLRGSPRLREWREDRLWRRGAIIPARSTPHRGQIGLPALCPCQTPRKTPSRFDPRGRESRVQVPVYTDTTPRDHPARPGARTRCVVVVDECCGRTQRVV